MELSGVPYRISHEEHPYSYALNIFDDMVDGAEDDDINDDNNTVNDQATKTDFASQNVQKRASFLELSVPSKGKEYYM